MNGMKFISPNTINMGADSKSIVRKSEDTGIDVSMGFKAIKQVAESKLISDKKIGILENEMKMNNLMNDSDLIFSDKNLYRNSEELTRAKNSFEEKYSSVLAERLNMNLSEEEMVELENRYNSTRNRLYNKIDSFEKENKLYQQNQKIMSNINGYSDSIMSLAYSGRLDVIDDNVNGMISNVDALYNNGTLTKEKRDDTIGNIIGGAYAIGLVSTEVKGIESKNISDEDKIEEINSLNELMEKDEFIKEQANVLSDTPNINMSKESIEMFIRENNKKGQYLIKQKINSYTTKGKLDKTDIKTLKINDLNNMQEKYYKGETYQAYVMAREKTGQPTEFVSCIDYLNNKEVQRKVYRENYNLKDLNDDKIPFQKLNSQAISSLKLLITDTANQIGISQEELAKTETNPDEIIAKVYARALDMVGDNIGTRDRMTQAKILVNQGIGTFQVFVGNERKFLDFENYELIKSFVLGAYDEKTMDTKNKNLSTDITRNFLNKQQQIKGTTEFMKATLNYMNTASGNEKEVREQQLGIMMSSGLALSRNALKGEEDDLIIPVKGGLISFADTTTELLSSNAEYGQIINGKEIDMSLNEIALLREYFLTEIGTKELENTAIALFNINGLPNTEEYQDTKTKGVTFKQLRKSGSIEQAMRQITIKYLRQSRGETVTKQLLNVKAGGI